MSGLYKGKPSSAKSRAALEARIASTAKPTPSGASVSPPPGPPGTPEPEGGTKEPVAPKKVPTRYETNRQSTIQHLGKPKDRHSGVLLALFLFDAFIVLASGDIIGNFGSLLKSKITRSA